MSPLKKMAALKCKVYNSSPDGKFFLMSVLSNLGFLGLNIKHAVTPQIPLLMLCCSYRVEQLTVLLCSSPS